MLPYVPHWQVVPFLSAADVGVDPDPPLAQPRDRADHQVLRVLARPAAGGGQRRADHGRDRPRPGQGEVFRAGDVDDFVRAVRVLADPERTAPPTPTAARDWTWEAQAEVLDEVYRRLLPDGCHPRRERRHRGLQHHALPAVLLDSLLGQTIGRDRMEIIAVDDGSTDGSGRQLDRLAAAPPGHRQGAPPGQLRRPGRPCNRGLELAHRPVRLLPRLRRLPRPGGAGAAGRRADRYGSDVVLGKVVGVNGRYVHQASSPQRAGRDLFDSALPWSLANTKLFRRDLVERHGLRFPEDMPVGSDQPFTIEAAVHAPRISVLADYNYYYAVRRLDARNITYRTPPRAAALRRGAGLDVARPVPEGTPRDAILVRHFTWEVAKLLQDDFLG